MIKYIGSKRVLVESIVKTIQRFNGCRTVVDLFSGTSRVGHALKRSGYRVLANDHNAYAHTLATCYVQADSEDVAKEARLLISELNALPGAPGYFTETFCLKSKYFQPQNGERIDAIRAAIAQKSLRPELEAVLLVSLMEAADRVDSTTGVQMAYLKSWAQRSSNVLELRLPDVLPQATFGKGGAYQMDALEAAHSLHGDIAYLDPPYNQHSYLGNYHIWESLVLWDKPEVYGKACKRIDCRSRSSRFNSKPKFIEAFSEIVSAVTADVLIVSFSNEGYLSREDLERILASRGEVTVFENDYKRYVGAQIGIYNPAGKKVGKIGHLRNKEFIYLVAPRVFSELGASA